MTQPRPTPPKSGGSVRGMQVFLIVFTIAGMWFINGGPLDRLLYGQQSSTASTQTTSLFPTFSQFVALAIGLLFVAVFIACATLIIAYVVRKPVFRLFNWRRLPNKGVETRNVTPLLEVREHWFAVTAWPLIWTTISTILMLWLVWVGYVMALPVFTAGSATLVAGLLGFVVSLRLMVSFWDTEWHRQVETAVFTLEGIVHKKINTPLSAMLVGESQEAEKESPIAEITEITTTDEVNKKLVKARKPVPNSGLLERIMGYIGKRNGMDNIIIFSRYEDPDQILYVPYAQFLVTLVRKTRAYVMAETRRLERAESKKYDISIGDPSTPFRPDIAVALMQEVDRRVLYWRSYFNTIRGELLKLGIEVPPLIVGYDIWRPPYQLPLWNEVAQRQEAVIPQVDIPEVDEEMIDVSDRYMS